MAELGLLPPAATWRRSRAAMLPPRPTRERGAEPDETTARLTLGLASAMEEHPLRVALLAPPWRPVTPDSDGDVEAAVALLADALVAGGHDVTLFAPPGSRSRARVVNVLDRTHELEVGASMVEADHVARAFAAIERAELDGTHYDVVHEHSGWTALAMADRLPLPVVHTVHTQLDETTRRWYRAHGGKAAIVCLSRAHAAGFPAGTRVDAVVPNPVQATDAAKDGALLWKEIVKAYRLGDVPEMVHGLLHWKARDLMKKGGRGWTPDDARKLSRDLILLLSDSRGRDLPLSLARERFALSLDRSYA
jgi:hypothetical protein